MLDKELIIIANQIKHQAIEKNYTISVAESCTGGLIAAYLTSVPGSSGYFSSGIVSYSNDAKIKLLNVPTNILTNFGAVSKETAECMAVGVQKLMGTNIAISVTGIAGPDGGSKTKPVGMVCFGLCGSGLTNSSTHYFTGKREEIRHLACRQALLMILDCLV